MKKMKIEKKLKILDNAIEKIDMNTVDLANAICDNIIEYYGEHNYKDFKNVVNNRLK